LDENGDMKFKKEEAKALEPPKMKPSASQQSHTMMKQESGMGGAPSATPMGRLPTQTGPSPGSAMLKTPQASSSIKTPASMTSAMKPDMSKDGKSKVPSATVTEPETPTVDYWADSSISPAELVRCFSGLSDLQSIGTWSQVRNMFTPSSTQSSDKSPKNSPRVSDISENDALKINISNSQWMPKEWFEDVGQGQMSALQLDTDDPLLAMDWDEAFEGLDLAQQGLQEEGKGKKKRDSLAPSSAWDPNLYSFQLDD